MKYLELNGIFTCPNCGKSTDLEGTFYTENNSPEDEWTIDCKYCDGEVRITVSLDEDYFPDDVD